MSGHYHGWGDIDPIPPVGAVTDPHLWLLVSFGEGRQSLRKILYLQLKLDTNRHPNLVCLSGNSETVYLDLPLQCLACTHAGPILDSYYHEPACTVLSTVHLLRENCQPQIQKGLYNNYATCNTTDFGS